MSLQQSPGPRPAPHIIINAESLPTRCEICHQDDLFDASKNYCARCSGIALPPQVDQVRTREPRPESNPFTYLLGLIIGACIYLPIGFVKLILLSNRPAEFQREVGAIVRRFRQALNLPYMRSTALGGLIGAAAMFTLSATLSFSLLPITAHLFPILMGLFMGIIVSSDLHSSNNNRRR